MVEQPKGQGPGYRVSAKPLATVVGGLLYYGFKCRSCGVEYAVFDDPRQTGELVAEGLGTMFCDCPNCAAGHQYSASELMSFRAS